METISDSSFDTRDMRSAMDEDCFQKNPSSRILSQCCKQERWNDCNECRLGVETVPFCSRAELLALMRGTSSMSVQKPIAFLGWSEDDWMRQSVIRFDSLVETYSYKTHQCICRYYSNPGMFDDCNCATRIPTRTEFHCIMRLRFASGEKNEVSLSKVPLFEDGALPDVRLEQQKTRFRHLMSPLVFGADGKHVRRAITPFDVAPDAVGHIHLCIWGGDWWNQPSTDISKSFAFEHVPRIADKVCFMNPYPHLQA